MKFMQLYLKCKNIEEMKHFYSTVLELPLVHDGESSFSVMAGTTKIIFERIEHVPYYHFCLRTNGPFYDYMFEKLGKASVLLADEEGHYSSFWKGKQAYFLDPDGNVVEMLERPFSYEYHSAPHGWFDVGEVGLPVTKISVMQNHLKEFVSNENEAESETFAFYGDKKGVFVLVKEGRPWYPTERPAEIHPIKVVVSGVQNVSFQHDALPYTVVVKKEWNDHLPAVQFRIARPTNQLDNIARFYRDGLRLKQIGEFRNHEDYDGMMFGLPQRDYHLEFTQYNQEMDLPKPTKEHLLVFYIPNLYELTAICNRLSAMGFTEIVPENPYWTRGGRTFEDPDGYPIVLMNTIGI